MLDLKTLLDKIADFAMSAGVKLVISAVILIVGFKLIGLFVRKMKNRKRKLLRLRILEIKNVLLL